MGQSLVILAAGIGSRFGGLKQIIPVSKSGESIIDFSIYDAIRSGFSKIIIVIRKDIREDFYHFFGRRLEKHVDIEYAFQEIDPEIFPGRKKPPGTAHAVLTAKKCVDGPFAVINADDFYGFDSFQKAEGFLGSNQSEKENAVIGYRLKNTLSEHGTVSRAECRVDKNSYLTGIQELHKVFKKEGLLYYQSNRADNRISEDTYVSMNFWCYKPEILSYFEFEWNEFKKNSRSNDTLEFLIPSVVNDMIEKKEATFKVIPTESQWFGITYKEDFDKVSSGISNLIGSGVYPSPLWK